MKSKIKQSEGFTLVELLVVIGIIALLISILMPSLANARRAARTVACLSNMRQMSMGMVMYVQESKGFIPGNAWTSAAFMKKPPLIYNDNNCPFVSQTYDWMAPIAKIMGIKFEEGGTPAQREARFLYLNNHPVFQCSEIGETLMPAWSGTPSPIKATSKQMSYVSAYLFQIARGPAGTNDALYQGFSGLDVPLSFKPKITKIGSPSEKIFVADGSRWANNATVGPDYNLGWDHSGSGANANTSDSPGAQYAEYGPWSPFTRTYFKDSGALVGSAQWVRSMRHGTRKMGQKFGEYRMNVVFFDGHAETLNGKEARNPNLWMPRGTVLSTSECYPDVATDFFNGQATMTIK